MTVCWWRWFLGPRWFTGLISCSFNSTLRRFCTNNRRFVCYNTMVLSHHAVLPTFLKCSLNVSTTFQKNVSGLNIESQVLVLCWRRNVEDFLQMRCQRIISHVFVFLTTWGFSLLFSSWLPPSSSLSSSAMMSIEAAESRYIVWEQT